MESSVLDLGSIYHVEYACAPPKVPAWNTLWTPPSTSNLLKAVLNICFVAHCSM